MTCATISEHLDTIRAELAAVGLELPDDAYGFSNDPMGARPWNPDWATHRASELAAAAGVKLNIKGCGTTRRVSCLRRGSTCETPRRALAMAAAEQPHCGTAPTRSLKSTGELPTTSRSSPPDPQSRVAYICGYETQQRQDLNSASAS